jgi:hypothetical protein
MLREIKIAMFKISSSPYLAERIKIWREISPWRIESKIITAAV